MGLVLYLAGPVSTAQPTASEQVLRCNGVNNQSYVCELGHCCDEDQCCSYFYEYWWFWLVWAIIVILICSCLFHHRRIKHRLQQQRRQHEINLIAYREAHIHSAPPFYHRFLPNSLLPAYDEVMGHPVTPPPPYNLNSGPPVCSSTDLQDVQCPSRQSTPVPTASVALCSSPCIDGFQSSREQEHKVHGADRTSDSALKQDAIRTRPLRAAELPEEEKERILRRHRHFTGDSGIEVCLCDPGTESQEPKELEKLLGENSHERSMEFCERCSVGANGDDEEGERGAELGASLLNEPDPQTGNEQGGPRDPQS